MGRKSSEDDSTESVYFGIRTALAGAISEAAKHIASQGAAAKSAPAVIKLVTQIAARFSIPITEKAAAQAVPIIGAAGGALINTLFIDHFQDVAWGHFVVRRLERTYDPKIVRASYEKLPSSESKI